MFVKRHATDSLLQHQTDRYHKNDPKDTFPVLMMESACAEKDTESNNEKFYLADDMFETSQDCDCTKLDLPNQ